MLLQMVWSLGITPVTMIITRKKKSVFIDLIGNDYYQENEVCFIALIGNDYYQDNEVRFIALIKNDYYQEYEVSFITLIGSCIMYFLIYMKWSSIVFFWNNCTQKGSQTLSANFCLNMWHRNLLRELNKRRQTMLEFLTRWVLVGC